MERQRTITDLPLEVLDLIYKYCKNLANKVPLAQSHPILAQAYVYHSRNDFKLVPRYNNISLDSWRFILPLCGTNVTEFSKQIWNADDLKLKDLVALHCPNLQTIKLNFYNHTVDAVIAFVWKVKDGLRFAELAQEYNENTMPKLVQGLPEMSLLRILKIKYIHVEDVCHLKKYVNLEELDIEIYRRHFIVHPTSPHTVNIFNICAPMTKLRLLRIVGLTIASEDTDLETPLIALEKMNVEYCDILMDFPTCPKLQAMKFRENKTFDTVDSVRRSILNQGESLESLVYCRDNTLYDNQGLLELIGGCRKLRHLRLLIRNVKFTLDSVGQIVNTLRKNGLTPNDPLNMVIDEYFKFKWLRHWLDHTVGSDVLSPQLGRILTD